jgi:putative FmdB family regulatory protein
MKCVQCNDVTEVICKYEDIPKECEKCKGEVRQLISNTNFELKGSGWFVTDYQGKKPK